MSSIKNIEPIENTLLAIRQLGFHFKSNNNKLQCIHWQGRSLNQQQRSWIQSHKNEILAVLEGQTHKATSHQFRIWFENQYERDLPGLHDIPILLIFENKLNVKKLEEAFNALVNTYPALRTTFKVAEDTLCQYINADKVNYTIEEITTTETELKNIAQNLISNFDLENGPLFRLTLIKTENRHSLFLNFSHIIMDGYAIGIFLEKLSIYYNSAKIKHSIELNDNQFDLIDYSYWQSYYQKTPEYYKLIEFWKNKLTVCNNIGFPIDYPRPHYKTYNGAVIEKSCNKQLTTQIFAYCKKINILPSNFFLALLHQLLNVRVNLSVTTVGTVVANRSNNNFDKQLGFFSQTLPFSYFHNNTDTFKSFFQQCQNELNQLLLYQNVSINELLDLCPSSRESNHDPLFQVFFNYIRSQNYFKTNFDNANLEQVISFYQYAKFPMTFNIIEHEEVIEIKIEYNTDLYHPDSIVNIVNHYMDIIDHVVNSVSVYIKDTPRWSPDEKQFLESVNKTQHDYQDSTHLVDLIQNQLLNSSTKPKVYSGQEVVNCQDFESRSNQLANYLMMLLHDFNYASDEMRNIGICMHRGIDMIVTIMAILKLGCAYVPIDPEYPDERIDYILNDSDILILITDVKLVNLTYQGKFPKSRILSVIDKRNNINAASNVFNLPRHENNPITYIIYTSGSTGKPKGVVLRNRGIVNRLQWMQHYLQITAEDRILQKTQFTFDVSVWELLLPLISTASLVFAEPKKHLDPKYILSIINETHITIIHFVPSMLAIFVDYLQRLGSYKIPSLKHIVCSGEALSQELVNRSYKLLPHVKIHNLYGPTEASIDVSYHECHIDNLFTQAPIGKPIWNTQLYVLDSNLQTMPIGTTGELYISGHGLAEGYLNQDNQTSEVFVKNLTIDEIIIHDLYKTGDLARWHIDGHLEYLGRIDHQIKLRGHRIELEEIELVARKFKQITNAAVIIKGNAENKYLVLYYQLRQGVDVNKDEIKSFLQTKLPGYMIPREFNRLASIPLTHSGKVDRKLLSDLMPTTEDKPDIVTKLNASDYQRIVYEWNQTDNLYPNNKTIHQLFQEQVSLNPSKKAIVFEGKVLSYHDLNSQANKLARTIRSRYRQATKQALTPDTFICLYIDRSIELVISILAVFKAGGAYVPIDPNYPKDRVDFILRDTDCKLLLTQHHLLASLDLHDEVKTIVVNDKTYQDEDDRDLPTYSHPTDLCYVIYTSGTTGRPKGVMVEHTSVVNLLSSLQPLYDINKDHFRVSAYTSYIFDVSVSEIFSALIYGAELHIFSEECRKSPERLVRYIQKEAIHYVYLPPAILSLMPRESYPSIYKIIFAGEPCPKETAQYWSNNYSLYNYYGPTEATIYATGKKVNANSPNVIGKPINNLRTYVLDEHLDPVPIGEIGELYIGGVGIARGYLNLEELTLKAFIDNPFTTNLDKEKGYLRLYKTGDLVRYLTDGNIEYIGRNDFQAKISGVRIELSEIESVVSGYSSIKQNIVLALDSVSNNDAINSKYLVLYYVADEPIVEKDLRTYLFGKLPDYMVPNIFISIESMPLSSTGKLNRNALPRPDFNRNSQQDASVLSESEKKLTLIWKELFGLEKINLDDNFFRLGGNSLMIVRLANAIKQRFEVAVSYKSLFNAPVLREMASAIKAAGDSILHDSLKLNIEKANHNETLYASRAQSRLWLIQNMGEQSYAYNIVYYLRITGCLDTKRFKNALERVVEKHAILRSCLNYSHGKFIQTIIPFNQFNKDYFIEHEISKEQLSSQLQQLGKHSFDLSKTPLFSTHLLQEDQNHWHFLLNVHHAIFDGWSFPIFCQDLEYFYQQSENEKIEQCDEDRDFIDFAQWENQCMALNVNSESLQYWQRQLAHSNRALNLPYCYLPDIGNDYSGEICTYEIPALQVEKLRQYAKLCSVTPFVICLSAYSYLMHVYTQETDIIIGTSVANREHESLVNAIGYFVNMLPLRMSVNPVNTAETVINAANLVLKETLSNQSIPFDELVRISDAKGSHLLSPLFQTTLFLEDNSKTSEHKFSDLGLEVVPLELGIAKFELSVHINLACDASTISVNYRRNLFDKEFAQKLSTDFLSLLDELCQSSTNEQLCHIVERAKVIPCDTHKYVGWNKLSEKLTQDDQSADKLNDYYDLKLSILWQETLNKEHCSVLDNFFDLGADSFDALRLLMKINHEFNVNLTVAWVFLNRTIQQQSKSLRQAGGEISYEPIVQFKKSDSDKSLIFLHPAIGGAECYKNLSGFIDVPVNTYAVESYNLYGTDTPCDSIPLLGKRYADIIMYTIPSLSSCTLGGWSLGGLLSFEVARVLRHRGITIDEIILIDTLYHDSEERALQTSFKPVYEYIHKHDPFYQSLPPQYHKRLMSVGMAESDALAKYEPETYTGSVVLLKAMKGMNPVTLPKNALGQQFLEFHKTLYKKPDNGWKQFAKDLIIYEFNADHQTIMYDTSIAKEMGKVVASLLK